MVSQTLTPGMSVVGHACLYKGGTTGTALHWSKNTHSYTLTLLPEASRPQD